MAEFIGKGSLKGFSQVRTINHSIKVNEVSKLLNLPKEFSDNLIVVRQNKKLGDDEYIQNEDQVYLFFSAMGG